MKKALRAAVLGAGVGVAALSGAASAYADTTVTASPVTFVDTCGTAHDTYIIPKTTGVSYWVGGVKIDPGVHNVDPKNQYVQVFTLADPGYKLGSPATWDHNFDSTTGCSSSSASPSSSSSSSSSSSASPSASPSSSVPAIAVPSSGSGGSGSSGSGSSSSSKASASSLPHTGLDMQTPAAIAGSAAFAGVALIGGSRVKKTKRD